VHRDLWVQPASGALQILSQMITLIGNFWYWRTNCVIKIWQRISKIKLTIFLFIIQQEAIKHLFWFESVKVKRQKFWPAPVNPGITDKFFSHTDSPLLISLVLNASKTALTAKNLIKWYNISF
jgi:hypothetical protein